LGLVATAAPYLLYARGLRSVRSGTAGALTLAEPLTAALLSVALVGERISMAQAIGCLIIFGGMAAIVVDSRTWADKAQPVDHGMTADDSATLELPLMSFASVVPGTIAVVELPVVRKAPARLGIPQAGPVRNATDA
jgi:hypothetical protein